MATGVIFAGMATGVGAAVYYGITEVNKIHEEKENLKKIADSCEVESID